VSKRNKRKEQLRKLRQSIRRPNTGNTSTKVQAKGKLDRNYLIGYICIILAASTALFGILGPVQSLVPQQVVPHYFPLNITYHTEGWNWTIANACKCLPDSAYYPIDIGFSADLWLNTTGELDVGKSVDFAITIGNLEAYLPSSEPPQVIARDTLDIPNNHINAVFLTNSVFASNNSMAVIPLISVPSTNVAGFPTPGWTANETITFTVAGETYLRLDIPTKFSHIKERESLIVDIHPANVSQSKLIPIVNIQPQSNSESSDVLSLREWIAFGGGFGWLALGGILVLFVRKKEDS
jgi:hypothetical protein